MERPLGLAARRISNVFTALGEKMSFHIRALTSIFGFILGFVGWPATLRLSGRLGRLLTRDWNQRLVFSGYAIRILGQAFLLLTLLAPLELNILLFSRGSASSKEVSAVVVGSSLLGFLAYGLLSKIAAGARNVTRRRSRHDKDRKRTVR